MVDLRHRGKGHGLEDFAEPLDVLGLFIEVQHFSQHHL